MSSKISAKINLDDGQDLIFRPEEAEQILRAIYNNEVDALIVKTPNGDRVFTLSGSEHAYRAMIEMMNEGAAIIARNGTIFYSNQFFAEILKANLEKLIGSSIHNFIQPHEKKSFRAFLKQGYESSGRNELVLQAADGTCVPVLISASNLPGLKSAALCLIATDISESRQSEESLRKSEQELRVKTKSLEEVNTALKVLLKRMEEGQIELEEKILSNIRELVLPYLDELKKTPLSGNQISCLNIAETNLNHIGSSFLYHLKMRYLNLTPREIQIAALVKEGRSVKEIASFLNVSSKTVEFHKNSLRNKLGLKNKKVSLRSHLLTF